MPRLKEEKPVWRVRGNYTLKKRDKKKRKNHVLVHGRRREKRDKNGKKEKSLNLLGKEGRSETLYLA